MNVKQGENRPEEGCENRLADPSQAKAGKRDAELRGAQEGVEPQQDEVGDQRPPVAAAHERAQLGVAHLHERELGRHEEPVQDYESGYGQETQRNGKQGIPGHVTGSPPRR